MEDSNSVETAREWANNVLEETYDQLTEEKGVNRPRIEAPRYSTGAPRIAWTGEDGVYRNLGGEFVEHGDEQRLKLEGNAWYDDLEAGKRSFSGSLGYNSVTFPVGSWDNIEDELPHQDLKEDARKMYKAVSQLSEENLVFEGEIGYDPEEIVSPY